MSTPQTPATALKPALNGAKTKTRKRVSKANAKFEPAHFREQLLTIIEEGDEVHFDTLSTRLDVTGNTLEYRRYGETLFEVLITGGIITPGGVVEQDEDIESKHHVFAAENSIEAIRPWVEVFNKLVRRYKYLVRPLCETLKNLMQHVNKWSTADANKLSILVALLATHTQLVPLSAVTALLHDHLVKEGMALVCLTAILKIALNELGIQQLGRLLTKNKLDSRLIEFFPPNKQDEESFARHFEVEEMKAIVDWHHGVRENTLKVELVDHVREMVQEEESARDVASYIAKCSRENHWSESDVATLVWDAVMGAVDWATRPETVEAQVLRQTKEWSLVLAAFCTEPKTEVLLLKHVQVYCYENAKLMKFFSTMIQNLYKEDVLSGGAILFWHAKGAVAQGKAVFLKQMDPFVDFLENMSSDEEEDDDDDEQ